MRGRKIVTRKVKKMIKLIKDKETKTKIRYTVKNGAGFPADSGAVTGSIYVDKDSDLAVLDEIILQIN